MSEVKEVGPQTLAAFDGLCAEVEAAVVRCCLDEEGAPKAMGAEAEGMMLRGMGFVSRMLRTSMAFSAGAVLDNQADWAATRLPVYGIDLGLVERNLARYGRELEARLPPAAWTEVKPWLEGLAARFSTTPRP